VQVSVLLASLREEDGAEDSDSDGEAEDSDGDGLDGFTRPTVHFQPQRRKIISREKLKR